MNQPGKVANSARGHLKREKGFKNDFFLSPFEPEKFVSRDGVRPSRPASARSFYTLKLNILYIVIV